LSLIKISHLFLKITWWSKLPQYRGYFDHLYQITCRS